MLQDAAAPVVMETHGGNGHIWQACYSEVADGVVFEKDERKVGRLARQRPAWAVYQADSVMALGSGAGRHLAVNVLDVDPYGDPWPTIAAFFASERPRPDPLYVVVNDGLRQKIKMGGAWSVGTMQGVVQRYGNDLYDVYLDVCEELMHEQAVKAGYALDRFTGFYCGYMRQMTHYLAVLTRGVIDFPAA